MAYTVQYLLLLSLLLISSQGSNSSAARQRSVRRWAARAIWNQQRNVLYIPGDSCVVISAPHDGNLKPRTIPDRRRYGCRLGNGKCSWRSRCRRGRRKCKAVLSRDGRSAEAAWMVARHLAAAGIRPHVIINHLHRIKMDPNRGGASLAEATQSSRAAKLAYDSYHAFLGRAVANVKLQHHGIGLLIDFHRQKHAQNWTEIGYRLSKASLNAGRYRSQKMSIRGLIGRSGKSASSFVIGQRSFGSLLASFGHRVVPSNRIQKPLAGGYYRGGYITANYGSVSGGSFDSLQVEITAAVLGARKAIRKKFACDLAKTARMFLTENYCG